MDDFHSDPKLLNLPVVALQRLNLFKHLDELSDACLDELLKQLHSNVVDSCPKEQLSVSKTDIVKENNQDEIQILEVKPLPRKERVTLKRDPRLRKAPQASENKTLKMSALPEDNPLQIAKLQEAMDNVNDKLASLRERERKLLESVKRNKKTIDPMVEHELAAMSGAEMMPIFSGLKSAAPIMQKQEKIRRDKIPEFTFGDMSLKNILKSAVNTPEEKFRILDARDKLYQSERQKHGLEGQKGHKLVGTCPDMCPEKERLRRCYQAQVSPFEMVDYPKNTEMKEEWMVKEYARSSADQDTPLPHDLRPVPVLEMTMLHLCENIADKCEFDDLFLEEWYMFLWDRTRAIRKDITQQDVCEPAAARLLEQCARFHIHCADRLAGQDLSVYDDKINTENLTKCLQTLKYMYNDLASVGVACSNAPEFLCYSLLLNLNNPAIMTEVRDIPEEVLFSAPVRFALDIIAARETKNYHKFFKLVKETTYLNCCLLRRYFSEMRQYAISTVVWGFCPRGKSTTMDVLPLANGLMFEGIDECAEHLHICNLQTKERDGYPVAILNRRTYQPPDGAFPILPSLRYIQGKREVLASEIIWGGPLPAAAQIPHILQNSFTSSGELKPDSLTEELLQRSAERKIEKHADTFGSFEVIDVEEVDRGTGEVVEETDNVFSSGKVVQFDFTQDVEPSLHEGHAKTEGSAHVVSSNNIFSTSPTGSFRAFGGNPTVEVPAAAPAPGFSFASIFNVTSQTTPTVVPAIVPEPTLPLNKGDNSGFFKAPAFVYTFNPPIDSAAVEKERLEREKEQKLKQAREEEQRFQRELALAKKREEEKARVAKEEAERRDREIALARKRVEEEKRREAEIAEERRRIEAKRKEERRQKEREKELEKERLRLLDEQKKIAERLRLKNIREKKLHSLRKKYRVWKLKTFISHWRNKAWAAAESRRMQRYREELRRNYPLICHSDLLDGNPCGVVIPNTLLVKRSATEIRRPPTARDIPQGPPPSLPLVHMGGAVAPSLEKRVHALYPDPNAAFRTLFPWKLLLCLPDTEETPIRLDTFLEMHFVERFDWKFGVESAPLAHCIHQIDSLELDIIVRRVKGRRCFEGATPNPDAVIGANSLLFFLTDDVRSLPTAHQRLNEIRRAPGGSQVPLIVFVFGNRITEDQVRKSLRLDGCCNVVICCGSSQESLVTTLSESLSMAASVASPVASVRAVTLNSFLKTAILDRPWRRAERAIFNFDILLKKPEPLITFYNECIDELTALFLEPELETMPRLAPEFESVLSRIETPLEICPVPKRDVPYRIKLKKFLEMLKLPAWPSGTIKSTQALNYRLHQYGKMLVPGNRLEQKHLKWRIYRIIQRTLLWKGLDIYCDEDISLILLRFPWVDVFQEFARVLIERFISSKKNDLVVMFNKEALDEFYFSSSLVDDLVRSAAASTELGMEVDLDATAPHPEYDSILLAYSAAIERESAALEREKSLLSSLNIEDVLNSKKTVEFKPRDTGDLKRGFEELGDSLSELEANLKKRRADLEDLLAEVDSSREENANI